MANPFNGEVLIEDNDKRYKFVLGMYAQVILEEITGESGPAFWARAKEWSNTDLLRLFQAGLARHHGILADNTDEAKRNVADMMDRLGPEKCLEIVNEAITKASPPKPEQKEDAKGAARPPTAKKSRVLQATTT